MEVLALTWGGSPQCRGDFTSDKAFHSELFCSINGVTARLQPICACSGLQKLVVRPAALVRSTQPANKGGKEKTCHTSWHQPARQLLERQICLAGIKIRQIVSAGE